MQSYPNLGMHLFHTFTIINVWAESCKTLPLFCTEVGTEVIDVNNKDMTLSKFINQLKNIEYNGLNKN